MPKASPVKDFIAGGFGGICCVVAGHPLDTVKVNCIHKSSLLAMSHFLFSSGCWYFEVDFVPLYLLSNCLLIVCNGGNLLKYFIHVLCYPLL